LVQTETVSTLVSDGQPLFTTRQGMFLRGEGGWGGERGPSSKFEAPELDGVRAELEGAADALLHYNHGNALFRLGRLGPAILEYERARKLARDVGEDVVRPISNP
jgi:hypothetical protein